MSPEHHVRGGRDPRPGVDVPRRRHLLHQRAHSQRRQQHGHARESRLVSVQQGGPTGFYTGNGCTLYAV